MKDGPTNNNNINSSIVSRCLVG